MSYQVTVAPKGYQFSANPDETLLDAALRQNITLPHGCRNGACGACKGKLLSGSVDHAATPESTLSAAEKDAGMILYCCAKATSDMSLECRQAVRSGDIEAKTLPARIEKLERVASDVIVLGLRLPASEQLRFYAGQYIDIIMKDGRRRSYSLANAPEADGLLELHIRHVPGGAFTDALFETGKVRDILRFNGPHGSFYLREDSNAPIILLASGTGFAPIKAIVEHAIATGQSRPMHLYWGCRRREDLYLHDLATSWASNYSWLRYTPVLSEPAASDAWDGRQGFVHETVLADYADLAAHQVYACGAPVMVDAARRDFTQHRALPSEAFFADAFTFAAPGA